MNFNSFEEKFRDKASKAGYSEENIQKCLNYAKPLIKTNLPVIFNTSNLSALVGYKKNYIKKAALFTDSFYRRFVIKKRNGKPRYLKEPLPSLKEIQCWILENILYEIPVSRFAKAYIPKRNLLDNVKYHKDKKIVMCLDIEDFFSSIKRSSIEEIFRKKGYSSNIANLLSKLCCCNDFLPQGAPTSPYLSNIFMTEFDSILSMYCQRQNLRYTRYADDITVSGEINQPEIIKEFMKSELEKLRLTLNDNKSKVMGKNVRQIVTGIVVNQFIQVPKSMRDKIRQELFFIKKVGLQQHLKNTNNQRSNYVNHLIGKINYVLYINSKDKKMQEHYTFMQSFLNPTDSKKDD
ncbi:MAG: reverse transcriptase family protein [Chitinophagaceae bacterium]